MTRTGRHLYTSNSLKINLLTSVLPVLHEELHEIRGLAPAGVNRSFPNATFESIGNPEKLTDRPKASFDLLCRERCRYTPFIRLLWG